MGQQAHRNKEKKLPHISGDGFLGDGPPGEEGEEAAPPVCSNEEDASLHPVPSAVGNEAGCHDCIAVVGIQSSGYSS